MAHNEPVSRTDGLNLGEVLARVDSVQVGPVAPLGPLGVPSGFVKHPIHGPVRVRQLGLEGDRQADLKLHGGPEKAVYGYCASHYSAWSNDFPEHRERLAPGAFGENLTISGISETDLCLGDVHEIGSARLQVCQPRQPCFKLVLRFADKRMPRAMVRTGRSGWYYRVLEEGQLEAGNGVRLLERPHPSLRFARVLEIVNGHDASDAELALLASAKGVARWLRIAAKENLAGRRER